MMEATMTVEAVAAGMFLSIDQRLRASETVEIAGHAVEYLENRSLMNPGGLLRSLDRWRVDRGWAYDFISWFTMYGINPHINKATGRDRQYWLDLLSQSR